MSNFQNDEHDENTKLPFELILYTFDLIVRHCEQVELQKCSCQLFKDDFLHIKNFALVNSALSKQSVSIMTAIKNTLSQKCKFAFPSCVGNGALRRRMITFPFVSEWGDIGAVGETGCVGPVGPQGEQGCIGATPTKSVQVNSKASKRSHKIQTKNQFRMMQTQNSGRRR